MGQHLKEEVVACSSKWRDRQTQRGNQLQLIEIEVLEKNVRLEIKKIHHIGFRIEGGNGRKSQ